MPPRTSRSSDRALAMAQIGITSEGISKGISEGVADYMVFVCLPVFAACVIGTVGIACAMIHPRSGAARILGLVACLVGLVLLTQLTGFDDHLVFIGLPLLVGGASILLSFR